MLKLVRAGKITQFQILFEHPAGITGLLMLFIMGLMFTAAMPSVRRRNFELFYYTHQLAMVWVILVGLHGIGCFIRSIEGKCKGYFTWRWVLAGLAFYFLERVLRTIRSRQVTFITRVIEHPCDVLEIQFAKPSLSGNYKSGQYVFVNVPEVAHCQWHPFTLTSCPEEPHVSVHIRASGDWTERLRERLRESIDGKDPRPFPHLNVDGPFGTPSEDVRKYDAAILVGAGIGVTPFISVLKSIWYERIREEKSGKPLKLKKVYLVWICRDHEVI